MKNNNIIRLFLATVKKYSDKTAFNYFSQSWNMVTYGEFLQKTKGIAAHLRLSGINRGDRVAIVSENRYEWCASYLAAIMAGGIAVPVDAQLGPDEIKILLDDSGTVLVFHSGKMAANIKGLARKVDFDSPGFEEICNTPNAEDYPELAGEDLASIVYTSGTTGTPKGVMLTHNNFCSDAEALIDAGLVTHEDNVASILPLHHTYPFMCTFLVPLLLGATITYPMGMKGPELMATMKEKGVTVLVAVPQLLELIRNGIMRTFKEMPAAVSSVLFLLVRVCGSIRKRMGINVGKLIFGSAHKAFGEQFRFFASGGARLDPRIMNDLEAIGFTVLEGYGLTETSPVVTFNPLQRRKPGSVGKPLPSVEIQIVHPSESGEGDIAFKGPMVMKGYYKKPQATAAVMRESWFLTGDVGHLDNEGYLFITGRVKEVIVLSSGKNVYPEDVEREFLKIPLIKEICVTGVEENGDAVSLHGVVVLDFDYARKENIGTLKDTLRWKINEASITLPPYMRLKGFTLHPGPLPRTRLGKLKRYQIREFLTKATVEKPEEKKEDRKLLSDETGKKVAGCIMPLLRKSVPVRSEDNLELDLGLDSLQRIELVVAIEKGFSLKLPETFTSGIQTVGELVEKVKEFSAKKGREPSLSEEVVSDEITRQDKKRVGLQQGRTEWGITVFLLCILRVILKTLFSMEVKGIENLPLPSFIIAANHCSNMDGFIVGTAVPTSVFMKMHFQGFQTYFSGWWLPSLFGRLAHAIPIDSETFLSRAFRISSYVLKNDRILCIFPEGGRSFDGEIMQFKKGIAIFALKQNVPIVPALIEGTFEALPRGAFWPKFRKVKITFGRPFQLSQVELTQKPENVDEYQFFANVVREKVKGLKGSAPS